MPKQTLIPIIGIPIPPGLARSFGYTGPGRYVGAWWEHCADDLCLSDGRKTSCGMGFQHAWKTYSQHPVVIPYLQSYFLGASDVPATHALIIDQTKNRIMIGSQANSLHFLKENAPPMDPKEQAMYEELVTGKDFVIGQVEFDMNGFNASFKGTNFENPETMVAELIEQNKKENQLYSELQDWLDDHPGAYKGSRT